MAFEAIPGFDLDDVITPHFLEALKKSYNQNEFLFRTTAEDDQVEDTKETTTTYSEDDAQLDVTCVYRIKVPGVYAIAAGEILGPDKDGYHGFDPARLQVRTIQGAAGEVVRLSFTLRPLNHWCYAAFPSEADVPTLRYPGPAIGISPCVDALQLIKPYLKPIAELLIQYCEKQPSLLEGTDLARLASATNIRLAINAGLFSFVLRNVACAVSGMKLTSRAVCEHVLPLAKAVVSEFGDAFGLAHHADLQLEDLGTFLLDFWRSSNEYCLAEEENWVWADVADLVAKIARSEPCGNDPRPLVLLHDMFCAGLWGILSIEGVTEDEINFFHKERVNIVFAGASFILARPMSIRGFEANWARTPDPDVADGQVDKIRSLLASANPEAIILGFQILESSDLGPKAWRTIIDRSTVYSICLLAAQAAPPEDPEEPQFADRLLDALENGFSEKTTKGLSDACQRSLKAIDPNSQVDGLFDLCSRLATVGLESLFHDQRSMPIVRPEDAPFAVAAIGGLLGQILWRDIALEGRLGFQYVPDSFVGDRLMPDSSWRLIDEKCSAAGSPGCSLICNHGASYSLPWIEKHEYIDPVAIREDLFDYFYHGSEHQENLEPLFTEEGLVHCALEGLCDGHMLLLNEPAFDRRIERVFAGDSEMRCVTVRALDRPVREEFPQACFRELSAERKTWLADVLIAAAGSTVCPDSAALAKHVLGWMTIHSATPPELHERLTAHGFGVTNEPLPREAGTAAPNEPDRDRGEPPDRRRTVRLKKIVNAWEKICEVEGVSDLGTGEFLAAHYAKLVLAKDVILTKAGWEFIDELENSIIDTADEGDDEETDGES